MSYQDLLNTGLLRKDSKVRCVHGYHFQICWRLLKQQLNQLTDWKVFESYNIEKGEDEELMAIHCFDGLDCLKSDAIYFL